MKVFKQSILPTLIATALTSPVAWAQDECIDLDGAPPGLYATTDEGTTFLIKDGKTVELGPGEAGFADENGVTCIRKPPRFLDWPCATDAAKSRKFATYRIEDMGKPGNPEEVIQRYFEIPEVIEPIPNWIEGEYHTTLPLQQIISFASTEYWYHLDPTREIMNEKRPKVLLISLFVGLNKVVLDGNLVKALSEYYGDAPIPTAFLFNDSNTVPVSYFGPNVSLEEILKASNERGIKLAEPPVWWLGDYSFSVTIEEFEQLFDIPPLEEISQEKVAALRADIENDGFSEKPIIVTLFSDSGTLAVDQPQKVRVAASMGLTRLPTVIMTIEPDMLLARCGPGTPVGMDTSASISGETTPEGGANVPVGPVVPPLPEPPQSPSNDTGT